MSEALRIMRAHLARGGAQGPHTAIGQGAWQTLKDRGWDPRQITALIPHLGMQVGDWTTNKMSSFPNAASNIGQSGLFNLATAQKWVDKGMTPEQIAAHGSGLANTPRGRATGLSDWQGGFTSTARDWLVDHYSAQQQQQEEEEEVDEDAMWAERIANIPTATELMEAMPEPKIRAGQDYATTGRSAQGMRIKKGTKFAEGGKRGTKGYFGRGAKFTGDTTPAMNIKGGGGGSASQASNTLNTV